MTQFLVSLRLFPNQKYQQLLSPGNTVLSNFFIDEYIYYIVIIYIYYFLVCYVYRTACYAQNINNVTVPRTFIF